MALFPKWFFLIASLFLCILIPFVLLEERMTGLFHEALTSGLEKGGLAVLIVFFLASDVFLPVPSSIVSTASGALLGFAGGALACWLGMSLGCLVGYGVGSAAGTPVVRRIIGEAEFQKAEWLSQRYGPMFLIMLRAVPVLAEASVMTAGMTRMPVRIFIIITGLSNLGVSLVYAGIGAFAFASHSFGMVVFGAVIVPFSAMIVVRACFKDTFPAVSFLGKRPPEAKPPSAGQGERIVTQTFSVPYTYTVYFSNGIFHPSNLLLVQALSHKDSSRQRLVVFVDSGVMDAWPQLASEIAAYAEAHHEHLSLITRPMCIPGGEHCKSDPGILEEIYRQLFQLKVDRHSFVLAIGGGAVLDTVGYAAATAHRGIRLVRVPTTVLAQNDSGVGVKTGVNLFASKNFLGAFAVPYAVINDFSFLQTLSPRDRRGGLAEAVKVALIKDLKFFEWLEAHIAALNQFDEDAIASMIRRSAELHMKHISHNGDPFETGNSRPLDYGHWAAHKLESLSRHNIRHGEAVAMGMAIDTRYAAQMGFLPHRTAKRICRLLEELGFQLWHPAMETASSDGAPLLLNGIQEFREHLGGELSITMLQAIGRSVEVRSVDPWNIEEAIRWLKARNERQE